MRCQDKVCTAFFHTFFLDLLVQFYLYLNFSWFWLELFTSVCPSLWRRMTFAFPRSQKVTITQLPHKPLSPLTPPWVMPHHRRITKTHRRHPLCKRRVLPRSPPP